MTELQELMRQNVVDPPHDDLDLREVVSAGGRRVRARRRRVVGAAALATAAVTVMAVVLVPHGSPGTGPTAGRLSTYRPRLEGPFTCRTPRLRWRAATTAC
jgi:hypothetical protein